MGFSNRLVLLAIALGLSGCGDGGGNSSDGSFVTTASGGSPTTAPATAANPIVSVIADPVGGGEFGSGPWPAIVASTGPTSYVLIDNAVTAGALSEQTGLVYKVYADFGDPRLPAQYQGDDASIVEGHALQQAQAFHGSVGLSQANQDLLAPFLTPAYQAGSWWHLAHPEAKVAATETPKNFAGWLRTLAAFFVAPAVAAGPSPCYLRKALYAPTLTDWKVVKGSVAAVWYLVANEATDLPRATKLLSEIETNIWPALTKKLA